MAEFIAELALFLDESDEDVLPAETAANLQEAIAAALQELTPDEETAFVAILDGMAARADSAREASFFRDLPKQVGIRR